MQIDFLTVLIAVVSIIMFTLPGFILAKAKKLPQNAGETISTLVLYGCQPVLIFMSFQEHYRPEIAVNILNVALLTFIIHAVFYGVVCLLVRNKERSKKINTVRYASLFSNCGFMGLPFLQTVFGSSASGEIIIYAAVVIAVFNLFNWTLGVYIYSGDKKDISLKKILLNPTILSIFLGVLYFFIVRVPLVDFAEQGTTARFVLEKITGSLDVIGNLISPLAMTVIGIRLANVNLKGLFLDKTAYFASGIKLVLMSIITMLIVAFLPVDIIVKYLMFFLMSMPSATSTAMFAVTFGGDPDSASVYVLLSTVLSIITIPLLFLLMSGVFVPLV